MLDHLKFEEGTFFLLLEAAVFPLDRIPEQRKTLTCPQKKKLQTSFLLKTLLQRPLKRVFIQTRVSQPRRCHLSVNAYVQEPNQDTAGQLIEQYPGSDTRTGRSKLCSILPSSGARRRPETGALPCCCRGSLDDNYLLYLH